ncbi:MAG TPA: type III-A CRISPR-associated RAMP protein Csm3 [Verrucomicrobiae bacterium]|nr:type III-A CRISPR-associated RAMP protein Csm3 [Verrucomicrobiae bacterium]
MKKIAHREITGTIHCVSGLRIGGSEELLQIGGSDLACIKHPITLKPYLPGSSLKGKMRSELERAQGKFGGKGNNEPCGCGKEDCLICRVFGPHKKPQHNLGPTRIIVRDSQVLRGGETEFKSENVIDRKTGTALHPRKVERVVSGSQFSLRVGIQIWDIDNSCSFKSKSGGDALVEFIKDGLRALQQTGIGSGVSKGSGEIIFEDLSLDGQPFSL